jgi:hypothetical protein
MTNNSEWIKQWTANIRNHCDLIDHRTEIMLRMDNSDKQIKYLLKRLEMTEKRLRALMARPGKGKSYFQEVSFTANELKGLHNDVFLWSTQGILPDRLSAIMAKE